jgi:UDPglucose 6-dehydrogenase
VEVVGERSIALLSEVCAAAIAAETPLVVNDYATAKLVRVAANAFLATKFSFINAMAEIAEVTGADITQLTDAIDFDARLSPSSRMSTPSTCAGAPTS